MVDVKEATHVRGLGSKQIEKILVKWGINADGSLAPPSQGGFGVITESGHEIDMWNAAEYYKVEQ